MSGTVASGFRGLTVIRLVGIEKAFGARSLFRGVDLHFRTAERYGLFGANGAGKTTLLKILTGEEHPDAGSVIAPQNCIVAHLPQYANPHPRETVALECMSGHRELFTHSERVHALADELARSYSDTLHERFEEEERAFRMAGGQALESHARGLLVGLGFMSRDLDRNPLEFSGGWRMRIELAKILLRNPQVLVLDEPTNHLDLPSITWLEGKLQNFSGTLIFVSHDKSLLNRLATRILYLRGGRLSEFAGNFDAFLEQFEKVKEGLDREKARISAQADQLERFAERFGAKASLASRAKSKLKQAARLRQLEGEMESEEEQADWRIVLPSAPRSVQNVLELQALEVGHQKRLFDPLSVVIQRGMRVAIVGSNGAGKTTLLRTITGEIPALGGAIRVGENVSLAYFAQEQSEVLDPRSTILETVLRSHAEMDPRQARQLLGSLRFSGDDVEKKVEVLSGGEKNRVGLACLLAGHSSLLVLDEPTNHLDMAMVEALAEALGSFDGTLIFVSHNRDFIDAVCTHVLAVSRGGTVGLFEGKLDDYRLACARSGFPDVLLVDSGSGEDLTGSQNAADGAPHQNSSAATAHPGRVGWEENRAAKRERDKLSRRILAIEDQLESCASSRVRLEAEMAEAAAKPGVGYTELQRLGEGIRSLDERVQQLEEEWLVLGSQLDTLSEP